MPTLHIHDRFLFLHTFISEQGFELYSRFDCWRPRHRDDITVTFNDVITFSYVNLEDGVRDVLYYQCISENVKV